MYAVMKDNKYSGVVDEQSRHTTLREAVAAHDAMEFNGRSSIYEIKIDSEGEEEYVELSWESIYTELRA